LIKDLLCNYDKPLKKPEFYRIIVIVSFFNASYYLIIFSSPGRPIVIPISPSPADKGWVA